jgi:hypothetical protein
LKTRRNETIQFQTHVPQQGHFFRWQMLGGAMLMAATAGLQAGGVGPAGTQSTQGAGAGGFASQMGLAGFSPQALVSQLGLSVPQPGDLLSSLLPPKAACIIGAGG